MWLKNDASSPSEKSWDSPKGELRRAEAGVPLAEEGRNGISSSIPEPDRDGKISIFLSTLGGTSGAWIRLPPASPASRPGGPGISERAMPQRDHKISK